MRRRSRRSTIGRRRLRRSSGLIIAVILLLVRRAIGTVAVVLEVHVVHGGGGGLNSASLRLRRRHGTDRKRRMEGGLLRQTLKEIRKCLWGDDGGVGEVFEFLSAVLASNTCNRAGKTYGLDGTDGPVHHGGVHFFKRRHDERSDWQREHYRSQAVPNVVVGSVKVAVGLEY